MIKTINVEFSLKEFKQLSKMKVDNSWHEFILDMTGIQDDSIKEHKNSKHFWDRVNKKGDDDCWEWTGSILPNGYGQVRSNPIGLVSNRKRKIISTHKAAYILSKGKIPRGMFVLHKCDNKTCCNPNHLFLGNNKDNMNDMSNKGRNGNGKTRLSQDDVDLILELLDDNKTKTEICEIFKNNGKSLSVKQIDSILQLQPYYLNI